MKRSVVLLFTLILVLVIIIGVVGGITLSRLQQQNNPPGPTGTGTATTSSGTVETVTSPIATGMPYAQGDQLIDGSGHPFVLRGAETDSSFIYMKSWQDGKRPTNTLTSMLYQVMAHDWRMNVVRLPISGWIYAKDPVTYQSQLDQVVQRATAEGLYVVLAMHDDQHSGSPYPPEANLPKAENISFWKAIAAHYKNNPMVMFDVYNEPKDTSWQQWLHGGGTVAGATVVGFQDLVDAIRSTGARQIIIVEPGSAGGGGNSEEGGWATIGTNTINDPNILYSLHVYQGILYSDQQQDVKWGPILYHHPIYYGEWALLTNGYGQSGVAHCRGIAPGQADQAVKNFLSYMDSRHASWTAWQFAPHYLVQDYTSFTPTTLDIPWTCGDTNSSAGMGTVLKQYLLQSR